jgi:hypothetical protein
MAAVRTFEVGETLASFTEEPRNVMWYRSFINFTTFVTKTTMKNIVLYFSLIAKTNGKERLTLRLN